MNDSTRRDESSVMMELGVRIAGTGHYLPARIVTSEELEARAGLPPGWIERHNGVLERRWVSTETNASMAAEASRQALVAADLRLSDVDLILNCSGTQEQAIPDGAALLQRALGLGTSGIPCMSIHSTCLGFLSGLEVASSLLAVGRYRCVLLAAADIASCALDFDEPESATLLGDGAAAVVLVRAGPEEASRLHTIRIETYGDGAGLTEVRGGGSRRHPGNPESRVKDHLFHMAGRELLRVVRRRMPPFLERVSPGLTRGLGSIDLVVPHQASLVGLRLLDAFDWPREQVVRILEKVGNCVAASIPLALHDAIRHDRLRRGQRVLLLGTGAGISLGAAILTY